MTIFALLESVEAIRATSSLKGFLGLSEEGVNALRSVEFEQTSGVRSMQRGQIVSRQFLATGSEKRTKSKNSTVLI